VDKPGLRQQPTLRQEPMPTLHAVEYTMRRQREFLMGIIQKELEAAVVAERRRIKRILWSLQRELRNKRRPSDATVLAEAVGRIGGNDAPEGGA
jgi:hypothetical protein